MLFNAWIGVFEEASKRRGLSHEKFAALADVSTSTWSRWTTGTIHPKPHQFGNIAHALGYTETELGLLYVGKLHDHYQERDAEERKKATAAQAAPGAAEDAAPRAEDDRADTPNAPDRDDEAYDSGPQRPTVLVDLDAIIAKISELRPDLPRKRRWPRTTPSVVRRQKRRKP